MSSKNINTIGMAIQWTRSSDGSGKEQRAGVRMRKEGTKDLSVIPLIF